MKERIADKLTYPSKYIDINGSKMHYVEVGAGDPILFLHGIPTSCYLWRNVMPHLATLGRCIAPDLIGFGRSDRPDITYSIFDHIHFIEKFIEALNLKRLTLIMHGWGSVIGLHYAMQNEHRCKGIAFYEAYLRSLTIEDDISLPAQEQLLSLQMQAATADFTIDGVDFIDRILPQNVMRPLSENEMAYYRAPFLNNASVQPILQYIRELPNSSGEGKIEKIIADYSKKLTQSSLPKLMLYSVPGFITTIATVMWAKDHLPNLEIIDIGEELHLAQESNPALIGEMISAWLQGVEQARG